MSGGGTGLMSGGGLSIGSGGRGMSGFDGCSITRTITCNSVAREKQPQSSQRTQSVQSPHLFIRCVLVNVISERKPALRTLRLLSYTSFYRKVPGLSR